jgi:hypothetical protein
MRNAQNDANSEEVNSRFHRFSLQLRPRDRLRCRFKCRFRSDGGRLVTMTFLRSWAQEPGEGLMTSRR